MKLRELDEGGRQESGREKQQGKGLDRGRT